VVESQFDIPKIRAAGIEPHIKKQRCHWRSPHAGVAYSTTTLIATAPRPSKVPPGSATPVPGFLSKLTRVPAGKVGSGHE